MKIIYFADIMGDIKEEAQEIEKRLRKDGINNFKTIEIHDEPQFLENRRFDVLFFDWGGMSIGNSMLEHFCDEIIKHAEEHPSRIYVMNSTFTAYAMKDAIGSRPELKNIKNIFLSYANALPYLKSFNSREIK